MNPFSQIARKISPAEAPHLHAAVEDLCRKANISKPAICCVHDTRGLGPLFRHIFEHIAAATKIEEGPAIILGDKFRAIMGHHALNEPISEEMKSILAHEIGHIKNGDINKYKILPLRLSPILGMVAGAAGMWYYQHLQQKKEQAKLAGATEAEAHAAIAKEWEQSDQSSVPITQTFHHHVSAAKTIAGGLLGFAVGTGIFALGHRHIEFRADRCSAELMGSGQPLANALRHLRSGLQESFSAAAPDVHEAARKMNPVAKFFMSLMHPSDAQRITRLESWVR